MRLAEEAAEAEKLRQIAEVQEKERLEAEAKKLEEEEKAAKQKTLFKAQIAPKAPMAEMVGPPPFSDLDLESSPRKSAPVPLMSLTVEPPAEEKEAAVPNQEIRLPGAVEKVLAFKNEWASHVGVSPGDISRVELEGVPQLEQ